MLMLAAGGGFIRALVDAHGSTVVRIYFNSTSSRHKDFDVGFLFLHQRLSNLFILPTLLG